MAGSYGWLRIGRSLGFSALKNQLRGAGKGINDDELVDLALLARDHPFQVRLSN